MEAQHNLSKVLRSGILKQMLPDWELLWAKSFELSQAYASITGCRTLDTLHVAAAQHLGLRQFATSDHRQNSLASRVGLRVFDPTQPS